MLPGGQNIGLSDTVWGDAPKEIVIAHSLKDALEKAEDALGSEKCL